MGLHLQRASILYDQGRYDLAERELREELAADPDSATAHALLALCLAEREALDAATDEARRAIAAAPDAPLGHLAHAQVLRRRNRLDEALLAVEEAIRLDPETPSHHALAGVIQLGRGRWQEALACAERGLAADPEDNQCTNVRASALVNLGRRGEAGAALESALARDPESPQTHANRGWSLLHEGDPHRALEHFREALRLDPTSEFARAGIVEALKARSRVYGLFLRYFLWMARLQGQARFGVVIGGYLGYRVLLDVARSNPRVAPYLWPILIAYIVFAVMTWLAGPLFNLLLRLDRFGRLALSRDQLMGANAIGVTLALTLVCVVVWLAAPAGLATFGLVGALTFGPLALPLAGTFVTPRGWPRLVMGLVTAGLLLVRLLGIAAVFVLPGDAGDMPLQASTAIFFYGILASQFLANALAGVRVKT